MHILWTRACTTLVSLPPVHHSQPRLGHRSSRGSRGIPSVRKVRARERRKRVKGQRPSKRNVAADCPFWPPRRREGIRRQAANPRVAGRLSHGCPAEARGIPRILRWLDRAHPLPTSGQGDATAQDRARPTRCHSAKPPKFRVLISHYSTRARRTFLFPLSSLSVGDADAPPCEWKHLRERVCGCLLGKMGWDNLWARRRGWAEVIGFGEMMGWLLRVKGTNEPWNVMDNAWLCFIRWSMRGEIEINDILGENEGVCFVTQVYIQA